MIRNNNQQNGRRRGRGGGQGGGGMGGAPRPQGQNFGNNRLDIRQRGNATQLLEKYKALARDAAQQGDRVVSEYYLQYADHYFRVLNEIRERQPENQRGPRPGYDADDDDGQDVGNGYNPAYAAQNAAVGNSQDDDGEEREYAADDGQRGDNRRDEPRAQQPQRDDRPRRDDQRGRNDRQYEPRQNEGRQYDSRQNDGRSNEPRGGGEYRRDEPRGETRRDEPRGETRRDEPRGETRREELHGEVRRDEPRGEARRDEPRRDAPPRQDSRRDNGQRDQRPRRASAERPVEAASRALVVEDEPVLAGLPGPATLTPEPVAAAPEVAEVAAEEPPRRRRGRPRKVDVEAAAAAAALAEAEG